MATVVMINELVADIVEAQGGDGGEDNTLESVLRTYAILTKEKYM